MMYKPLKKKFQDLRGQFDIPEKYTDEGRFYVQVWGPKVSLSFLGPNVTELRNHHYFTDKSPNKFRSNIRHVLKTGMK